MMQKNTFVASLAAFLVLLSGCTQDTPNPNTMDGNTQNSLSGPGDTERSQPDPDDNKEKVSVPNSCGDIPPDKCGGGVTKGVCIKDGDKCVEISKFQSCEDFSDDADCIRSCYKDGNDCKKKDPATPCTSDPEKQPKKCAYDDRTGEWYNIGAYCTTRWGKTVSDYCAARVGVGCNFNIGGAQVCERSLTPGKCASIGGSKEALCTLAGAAMLDGSYLAAACTSFNVAKVAGFVKSNTVDFPTTTAGANVGVGGTALCTTTATPSCAPIANAIDICKSHFDANVAAGQPATEVTCRSLLVYISKAVATGDGQGIKRTQSALLHKYMPICEWKAGSDDCRLSATATQNPCSTLDETACTNTTNNPVCQWVP